MSEVDLNFKPAVPVFDANVRLGRRHDKRVSVDTVDGTLKAMEKAGIERALVYSFHAAYWDSGEGNQLLLDMIRGHANLVPQLVASPLDDLDTLAALVRENGVRSIRMLPMRPHYPFRDWMVKPLLDWMAAEHIPLWLPVEYPSHVEEILGNAYDLDPSEVHDTLKAHPDVTAVLTGVRYDDFVWAVFLLKSLPNLYLELSHFVMTDGLAMVIDAVGEDRIVFGSSFPELAMGPQLFGVHRYGFSETSLRAICAGNLERILGME